MNNDDERDYAEKADQRGQREAEREREDPVQFRYSISADLLNDAGRMGTRDPEHAPTVAEAQAYALLALVDAVRDLTAAVRDIQRVVP